MPEEKPPSPMALQVGDHLLLEQYPDGVLLHHQTQPHLLLGVHLILVKALNLHQMVSITLTF